MSRAALLILGVVPAAMGCRRESAETGTFSGEVGREVNLKTERGVQVRVPPGMAVRTLIEAWDGPLNERLYRHPGFYRVVSEFDVDGQKWRINGALTCGLLLFKDGEAVRESHPGFQASLGPIEDVLDWGEFLEQSLEGGTRRKVHVSHMDATCELMLRPRSVTVKCRYYDALNFQDYHTVYYQRSFEEIAFPWALKLLRGPDGRVEDWTIPNDTYEIERVNP
jgi:hypothetical protein